MKQSFVTGVYVDADSGVNAIIFRRIGKNLLRRAYPITPSRIRRVLYALSHQSGIGAINADLFYVRERGIDLS